jgi:hypothetical protein
VAKNNFIVKFKQALVLVLPVIFFVLFTNFQYKKLTGLWQFSPFSGWQLANNGMYAYKFIDSSKRQDVPARFKNIDNLVRKYFNKTQDSTKYPYEKEKASTYYMWSKGMPLMKYKDMVFKKDTLSTDFKKWASMGPYYSDYGLFLIKSYPLSYIKYFMLPNTIKYYAPPVEFLEYYNSGYKTVDNSAAKWFNYKDRNIKIRASSNRIRILDFYPILSGGINFIMLLSIIACISLGAFKEKSSFKTSILIGCLLWSINAMFTISVSSAALRFQSFPILTTAAFAMLFIDWIISKAFKPVGREEPSYSQTNLILTSRGAKI